MIILALRSDKPEAGLFIYEGHNKKAEIKWPAHLKLAETLNAKIEKILNESSISYDEVDAILVFKGPGSFTGLRISASVANALAYSLDVPIIAKASSNWLQHGIDDLLAGKNDKVAVPEYGSPAHITQPRK